MGALCGLIFVAPVTAIGGAERYPAPLKRVVQVRYWRF
jgi:hypothetical protein